MESKDILKAKIAMVVCQFLCDVVGHVVQQVFTLIMQFSSRVLSFRRSNLGFSVTGNRYLQMYDICETCPWAVYRGRNLYGLGVTAAFFTRQESVAGKFVRSQHVKCFDSEMVLLSSYLQISIATFSRNMNPGNYCIAGFLQFS